MAIVLPIIGVQAQGPKIYVDPEDNMFSTDTTTVGTNFTVSIKAAEFTQRIYSYELKLAYDNTMLEAVKSTIPTGHWLTPATPTNLFIVDPGTIYHDDGYVSFAMTMIGAEEGATGSGTIADVTFTITEAPTAEENLTSTIELRDLILVNPEATPIPEDQYDVVNGNYLFYVPAAPPPPPGPKPTIYVDPKDNVFYTSNSPVGTNFTISIKAVNFTEPGVFSYEFKLYYDNTMLEAVEASIPDGHWLTPATPTNIFKVDPGTINHTEGFVSFAVTLLGSEAGKTGDGTLTTIKFTITQAPPAEQNLSSTLELSDMILVDPEATAIPTDEYNIGNGNYVYSAAGPPAKNEDLNGDGQVNIEDIAIWGKAFGSKPGHARWDPAADLNGDEKVDMIDAVLICLAWTS